MLPVRPCGGTLGFVNQCALLGGGRIVLGSLLSSLGSIYWHLSSMHLSWWIKDLKILDFLNLCHVPTMPSSSGVTKNVPMLNLIKQAFCTIAIELGVW